MIIDGMDQKKTEIPHFAQKSSANDSLTKVKSHLVGVLVHGIGAFGFFDVQQWQHNSNLTLSIITHVLLMLTSLPRVLYLQMDNCWRENKNK